ncbi:hypothetical protein DIPPA_23862 [Diplonema papillatum]|nr:hypothetical protein DIPPA_23862 [Diplonema papillatum]
MQHAGQSFELLFVVVGEKAGQTFYETLARIVIDLCFPPRAEGSCSLVRGALVVRPANVNKFAEFTFPGESEEVILIQIEKVGFGASERCLHSLKRARPVVHVLFACVLPIKHPHFEEEYF